MKLTTPTEVGLWLKEECHKADKMERIFGPITSILAILSLGMLYYLAYLEWMSKLPKP